jgi:2-isopropylmalate synthase
VEKALAALSKARKPYLHIFMPLSPEALSNAVKMSGAQAVQSVAECVALGKKAGVPVQFSLSEAAMARQELLDELCRSSREAGADVLSFADTGGTLLPEEIAGLVKGALALFPKGKAPIIGAHCHNDLGLATANTLAAIQAGAGHVEVTLGGLGGRAGNAALEEIVFLISAHGERLSVSHGIALDKIGEASALLDGLTGVRTHPNKPIIGRCALSRGGDSISLRALPPRMRQLLLESVIGGRVSGGEGGVQHDEDTSLYRLESFNVVSGSHAPPMGVVVILRGGERLTQSAHGSGPIDALFKATDRALGLFPTLVSYSLYAESTGPDAPAQVTVTAEIKGRRFHGSHRSTDAIDASIRAYLKALNAIGESGIMDGRADFYVHGEFLWE